MVIVYSYMSLLIWLFLFSIVCPHIKVKVCFDIAQLRSIQSVGPLKAFYTFCSCLQSKVCCYVAMSVPTCTAKSSRHICLFLFALLHQIVLA